MTVADELAKLGKEVDRKIIVLKDIKKVGEYVAVVRFHKEVSAEIPVTVVAEGGAAVEEAPAEKAPVAEAPVEEAIDETEAPVEE
jgi:large subunit ribosomal protein L9